MKNKIIWALYRDGFNSLLSDFVYTSLLMLIASVSFYRVAISKKVTWLFLLKTLLVSLRKEKQKRVSESIFPFSTLFSFQNQINVLKNISEPYLKGAKFICLNLKGKIKVFFLQKSVSAEKSFILCLTASSIISSRLLIFATSLRWKKAFIFLLKRVF